MIENNDFSLPPIRKANSNERPKLPLLTVRSTASDEKTIKDYLDHLNTLRSQKNT